MQSMLSCPEAWRAVIRGVVCVGVMAMAGGTWAIETDFRGLFRQAIDAPPGQVIHTELTGTVAARIQKQIGTNARVYADVRTVRVLPQAGCRRLAVEFSAPEARVPTKDGGHAPLQGVGFQLNICRDGSPGGPEVAQGTGG